MNITKYRNTGISRRFFSGALRKVAGRPGFTIVELMIVIVVIAILASISIVAYTGVRQRAAITSAQTDLRQLATIFEMYRIDHGRFPYNNESLGNALDNYADVGPLGRESPDIDGKRHLHCTKNDGSDIWVFSRNVPRTDFESGIGFLYMHGSTGRIDIAEPIGNDVGDFPSGAQWACTSITGGEHDVVRWSSADVFQRQLGRQ